MADGVGIVLRELEGTGRQVFLEDSALPEQLQSATELRSKVTHYPGNSASSTQIMGTKDDDITLEGQFRDVWIGFDGGALSRMQALRALLLGQRFLELSWGSTFVRRGYLKRVEQTFKRAGDIGYRLTFQVDEADEAQVITPVAFPQPTEADLAEYLKRLDLRVNGLDYAIQALNVIQGVF
jgi:phage protein U